MNDCTERGEYRGPGNRFTREGATGSEEAEAIYSFFGLRVEGCVAGPVHG